MSTKEESALSTRLESPFATTIDEHLQVALLQRTIGEILKLHESATNAKALFVSHLIFDAVFNYDIQALKQIITRVDGAVPNSSIRNLYANIFGDALEDVLSYPDRSQLKIMPDDLVIIAMAKVCVWVSMSDPGNNAQKRKDKNDAIQMILERTGGRKNEPTKELLSTNYVEPEWMRSLPHSGGSPNL